MKKLAKQEEDNLLLKMKEGEHAAFSTLYAAHHDALFLYAFRLSGDDDLAADIVQESFMYLWIKREDLLIDTSLASYLFRMVRHKFLNVKKHMKVRGDFVENFQRYIEEGRNEVDNHIEEKELYAKLMDELAKLPEKVRKIFNMRQQNIPDKDIAEQLGISIKTVQNLMSQAAQKLTQALKRVIIFFFAT